MKKQKMTLEQHLTTANDLAIIRHHLNEIFNRLNAHYQRSSPVMKAILKLLRISSNNPFITIKGELDTDYHKIITTEQFVELGHIYYNIDTKGDK